MNNIRITNKRIVFNDVLKIEKADISRSDSHFTRLRLERQEAATVLVLNTETQKIILTRQFRYAISDKVNEPIYELLAGKVDEGESPFDAAIRETEEEVGYKIREKNMELLTSCFASPGYTSEKFHVFYATVTNRDKIGEGGGLKNENEHIEVIEMNIPEFRTLIMNGKIEDAKTYIAALFMIAKEGL